MIKVNPLVLSLGLPLLTLLATTILGYRAIAQKAEEHDMQLLRTTVDIRVATLQREIDQHLLRINELRALADECLRDQAKWKEERQDLLMQLLQLRQWRSRGKASYDEPEV